MTPLTPVRAIRRECGFCSRSTPDGCIAKCALSTKTSPRETPIGRINSYCREVCPGYPCEGGDQLHVIGTRENCWLFPFLGGRKPSKLRIPVISATESGGSRPPIPEEIGRLPNGISGRDGTEYASKQRAA